MDCHGTSQLYVLCAPIPYFFLDRLFTDVELIIPIPGSLNTSRLEENPAAIQIELSPHYQEEMRQLADYVHNVVGERYGKECMSE